MSWIRYPEYKPSGVEWLGEIPAHWEVKRLRHLGNAIIGLTYEPADVVDPDDQGVLVLRASNVSDGHIVLENNVFVRCAIPERLRTKLGDILICSRSGSRALIGKSAKIDGAAVGLTFGTFMTLFRSVCNDYLFYVFNSTLFDYQSGAFLTSTINQLTISNLKGLTVPVPPDGERSAIASFLDRETAKIDTLVAKKERLIELLQEKRSSLITHAVTQGLDPNVPMKDSGMEWLGKIPVHWSVEPLRWSLSIRSGEALPNTEFELEQQEDLSVPVIGGNGVMGYTDRGNIEQPAIAIGRVGALCGNVHLADTPAWVTDNALVCTVIKGLDRKFLMFALRSMKLNDWASQNAQPLITGSLVKSQKIGAPPLKEQREIVACVQEETDALGALIVKIRTGIDRLKEYRTALISAAVTGKIDVRKEVAS